MKRLYRILAFCALAGCTQSPAEMDAEITNRTAGGVRLNLQLPVSEATRSITGTEEQTVREVDVLSFKIDANADTFDYATTATLVSGQGLANQMYTAVLNSTSYLQRIVVVTNAHSDVAALVAATTKGTEKNAMLAKLNASIESGKDRWNSNSTSDYRAIPMWGESNPESVVSDTHQIGTTIALVRMLARIDVQLSGSATSQLKLKSVSLYNTNTTGRVVPDPANTTEEIRGTSGRYVYVTAPTVPAGATLKSTPILYTDFTAPGTTDVSIAGSIYTFEAPAATVDAQATCVVIGGLYGTETTPTYYRIDLFKQGSKTDRWPILRNHQYIVNITQVGGRGYATADAAFAAKPVNTTSDVRVWDQSGLKNVKFDGQYAFSVDPEQMTLYRNGYATAAATGENVAGIYTDVPAGWAVESVLADDGTNAGWLTFSPTSAGSGRTSVAAVATTNSTGASRVATATFRAGTMRMTVRVTQTATAAPLTLRAANASDADVTELVFQAAPDVAPAAQTLNIKWAPTDRSVTIASAQNTGATTAFPSGSGAPDSGTIPSGGGLKSYTIAPPAITNAEYVANPFIEKASKVDFTVTDGTTTLTKTVILRQSVPTVLANPATSYTLNGSTYSFNVRSNAKWVIKSVVENPSTAYAAFATSDMLMNKASDTMRPLFTGGPNPAPAGQGDPVTFTTATYPGKWGTIDVTFSSADSPARFADQKVTLMIAAAPIKIAGLGVAGNSEGGNVYNLMTLPNVGSTNTPQDASTMLTNTNNFGQFATSTVITTMNPTNQFGWKNTNGTSGGDQTITSSDLSTFVTWDPQMLFIGGNATFDTNFALYVKQQYLDKGKTVFISIQNNQSIWNMMQTVLGEKTMENWLSTGNAYPNGQGAVYQFNNTADPILQGPFGDLRQKYWGMQWDGSSVFWVNNNSQNAIIQYSTGTNQAGSTTVNGDPSWGFTAFRAVNTNLIMVFDDGFVRSDSSSGTNVSPFYIDPNTKRPVTKQYGGGSPQRPISNSTFVANVVAWVIAGNPKS